MDYYDRFDWKGDNDNEKKSLIRRIGGQILCFIIFVVIFSVLFSFLQPIVRHSKTDYLAAKKARLELEQNRDQDKINVEKEREDLVSEGKDLERKNDALEEQLKKLNEEINSLK